MLNYGAAEKNKVFADKLPKKARKTDKKRARRDGKKEILFG